MLDRGYGKAIQYFEGRVDGVNDVTWKVFIDQLVKPIPEPEDAIEQAEGSDSTA